VRSSCALPIVGRGPFAPGQARVTPACAGRSSRVGVVPHAEVVRSGYVTRSSRVGLKLAPRSDGTVHEPGRPASGMRPRSATARSRSV
jgi:hypothetical protein